MTTVPSVVVVILPYGAGGRSNVPQDCQEFVITMKVS